MLSDPLSTRIPLTFHFSTLELPTLIWYVGLDSLQIYRHECPNFLTLFLFCREECRYQILSRLSSTLISVLYTLSQPLSLLMKMDTQSFSLRLILLLPLLIYMTPCVRNLESLGTTTLHPTLVVFTPTVPCTPLVTERRMVADRMVPILVDFVLR